MTAVLLQEPGATVRAAARYPGRPERAACVPGRLGLGPRPRVAPPRGPLLPVGRRLAPGGFRAAGVSAEDLPPSLGGELTIRAAEGHSEEEEEATVDGAKEEVAAAEKTLEPVVAGSAAAAGGEDSLEEKPGIPQRWRVVGLVALSFILCNMDKVNMSVAVLPMAEELGWSATQRGLVSSAFFWGYSLTQVPAGYISTRIGGAKVLFWGVALWSLGTMLAPPAAKMSLSLLCLSRVLVGLGEGFAPSAATNIMAQQIPDNERSRAVTAVFGGLDLGSVVGLLVCGPLIRTFGWQSVFYIFAFIGFIWCAGWPLVKPENIDPLTARQRAEEEAALLKKERAESGASAEVAEADADEEIPIPWGEFMKTPAVWAVICAHFCFNWGYYTLLAWLPSFFEGALGANVQGSSLLTLLPYIAMVCMSPIVGPTADGLISKHGWSITHVRKLAQGISFAGPAVCMIACGLLCPATPAAANPTIVACIVGLLSVSFALGAWARAGLYCNHQDISPKYASALLGISNTAGAIPGILGVGLAGVLLDVTGSWPQALFFPTAACQLFGLVVYTIFGSSKRMNWR